MADEMAELARQALDEIRALGLHGRHLTPAKAMRLEQLATLVVHMNAVAAFEGIDLGIEPDVITELEHYVAFRQRRHAGELQQRHG